MNVYTFLDYRKNLFNCRQQLLHCCKTKACQQEFCNLNCVNKQLIKTFLFVSMKILRVPYVRSCLRRMYHNLYKYTLLVCRRALLFQKQIITRKIFQFCVVYSRNQSNDNNKKNASQYHSWMR